MALEHNPYAAPESELHPSPPDGAAEANRALVLAGLALALCPPLGWLLGRASHPAAMMLAAVPPPAVFALAYTVRASLRLADRGARAGWLRILAAAMASASAFLLCVAVAAAFSTQ